MLKSTANYSHYFSIYKTCLFFLIYAWVSVKGKNAIQYLFTTDMMSHPVNKGPRMSLSSLVALPRISPWHVKTAKLAKGQKS